MQWLEWKCIYQHRKVLWNLKKQKNTNWEEESNTHLTDHFQCWVYKILTEFQIEQRELPTNFFLNKESLDSVDIDTSVIYPPP